jgi:hypothetical protein
MVPSDPFFPETYLESRVWFREQLDRIQLVYPDAVILNQSLERHPDLTVDWIECPSESDQALILSTALHGVEGFTGTAVLHQFIEEFLPRLDPGRTSLLLIHAINPWGMHNRRQRNDQNVELNRNFRFTGDKAETIQNSSYSRMRDFLSPEDRLGNYWLESLGYYAGIIYRILMFGVPTIKEALLSGQLEDPKGPYFGGYEFQEECRLAMEIVAPVLREKSQVVHIDIHSGYGPAAGMSLVNSVLEEIPPQVWKERFSYPSIIRADPEAFYTISGDWTDALYRFNQQTLPGHSYYGTAFEFGTMGDGLIQQMRGLRAVIFENQLAQYGADSEDTAQRIKREYRELLDPPSKAYRESVVRASRQALQGILDYYQMFQ